MASVEGKPFFIQTETTTTETNPIVLSILSSDGQEVGQITVGHYNGVNFRINCFSEKSVTPFPQIAGGIWTFLKNSSHCPVWLNGEEVMTNSAFSEDCVFKDVEVFGLQFTADDTASVRYKTWIADTLVGKLNSTLLD